MKTILSFLYISLLFTSCSKKQDNCVRTYKGCEPLSQPFFLAIGCSACVETDDGTITVEMIGIEDNRTYGSACANQEAGTIKMNFEISQSGTNYGGTMTEEGCRETRLHNTFSTVNPYITIDKYELRLLKMYPVSNYINGPVDQDEYDAFLVIHEK